jgi:hypothetical protein
MPPRKPTPAPRKVTKATVAAAATQPAAPKPKRPAISPYPDLKMAISMLQHRLPHVGEERKKLIEKWVANLTRINNEMNRLRKLEELANSLTQPKQESLPL